ncbi:MAG: hypothetical protein JXR34_12230 [Bacteroidales bacterium]|nr:hypothetical protein [Bacteroidales bacterium]
MEYKGISYQEDQDLNLGILKLSENNIVSDFDFVLKVSIFVELVGFKRYKYVLFKKRDQDFEIGSRLYDITQNLIVKTLFYYGVKGIYFLVNEERYKKYQSLPEKVYAFQNMEEIVEHIRFSCEKRSQLK